MTYEPSIQEYNYPSFHKELMQEDTDFGDAVAPGEPAPEIELPTVRNGGFRLSDCRGVEPVLIELASIT